MRSRWSWNHREKKLFTRKKTNKKTKLNQTLEKRTGYWTGASLWFPADWSRWTWPAGPRRTPRGRGGTRLVTVTMQQETGRRAIPWSTRRRWVSVLIPQAVNTGMCVCVCVHIPVRRTVLRWWCHTSCAECTCGWCLTLRDFQTRLSRLNTHGYRR